MLEQALDTASEGASGVLQPVPLLLVILLVSLVLLHLVLPSWMPADWARLKKLPGPRPMYPFIGSIPFVPRNIKGFLPWLMDISSHYQGLFYLRLSRSVVVITTPELAEAVLSSTKEIVKGTDYDPLKPWLSEGLLTSAGSKWHSRRKALTPSFHFHILNEFIDIFNEQAGILADKIQCTNAEKIDIFPYVTRATLDIICETAMGVQIGAQEDDQSEYVKAVYRMGEIAFMRFLKPWLRIGWLYRCTHYYRDQVNSLRTLHGFTETVIRSRRSLGMGADVDVSSRCSSYEGTRRRKLAFLDLLLSLEVDGKPLSDSDIREEVDTFMFEGHDTTSAGVNWTLYNLGRSPECQDKAYQELVDVLGHIPRTITREDLPKLKYLEMTIKESLRLFPSVPFIQRQLMDDMRIGDYDIPRGCNVTVSIYSIHRDPAHWPEPELFRPDRFSPDSAGTRHPYSYIPFSAGPRNCIGQKFALLEEKVVVATLLHRFLVRSFNKCKDLPLTADIILRLEGGLWLSFTPRPLIGNEENLKYQQ